MYLIDTNVISEARKQRKANPGVRDFFKTTISNETPVFISVITIGELRRGVELIRHRGDLEQASVLEQWLKTIIRDYADNILPFGLEEAEIWGKLRAPNHENALDKQIAASALLYDLTLVSRNTKDFSGTGVRVLNPFS